MLVVIDLVVADLWGDLVLAVAVTVLEVVPSDLIVTILVMVLLAVAVIASVAHRDLMIEMVAEVVVAAAEVGEVMLKINLVDNSGCDFIIIIPRNQSQLQIPTLCESFFHLIRLIENLAIHIHMLYLT
jgi:hypothetical protein